MVQTEIPDLQLQLEVLATFSKTTKNDTDNNTYVKPRKQKKVEIFQEHSASVLKYSPCKKYHCISYTRHAKQESHGIFQTPKPSNAQVILNGF